MHRLIGFASGPLLFIGIILLIPESWLADNAVKTIGVAAWMITWWITESVPIPVTAMLPLVLFPFLGIMDMSDSASPYANPIIFLFMGGFLIALALEKHRLHERIALHLIRITGTSGNGIILGFMVAAAGLSMWISNTATAMMMLPIAMSVVDLLKKNKGQAIHEFNKSERNFALGLMLMVGYAATLGGMATLIGTPPNVVFAGLLNKFYQEKISFADWMIIGVPVAIVLLTSTYLIITKILFPNRLHKVEGTDALIASRLTDLGPISKKEKRVLSIFIFTSFLWIFQELLNAYVFGKPVFNDTNIAMCGGLLMFIVPANLKKMEFLLHWKDTERMQWGILLLFGGGLCLAQALKVTGIINSVGDWIAAQSTYNALLLLLLIVISVFLSELMSNVALVQIFVPVIFGISDGLDVSPVMLALPVTLSASIGFMFPIATPPNAIVYSSGYIRMKDMVRAGVLLNIVSIIIILIASLTLVRWMF
ncbi:MAG TPA: DASS family sodium-coupled anion symporter [Ohtaekwangia sp.]|nr:DASS family sodium-coupled anion symporter [Ohtaekwangia sp.]